MTRAPSPQKSCQTQVMLSQSHRIQTLFYINVYLSIHKYQQSLCNLSLASFIHFRLSWWRWFCTSCVCFILYLSIRFYIAVYDDSNFWMFMRMLQPASMNTTLCRIIKWCPSFIHVCSFCICFILVCSFCICFILYLTGQPKKS